MYRVGPPLWEVQSGRPPNFSDDLAKIIMEADILPALIVGDEGQSNWLWLPKCFSATLLDAAINAIHPMLKHALGDRLRDKHAPILVRPKADHGRK